MPSISSYGRLKFIDCWAEDAGGAFVSIGPADLMGDVLIRNTSSNNRGACSLNSGGAVADASVRACAVPNVPSFLALWLQDPSMVPTSGSKASAELQSRP